MNTLMRTLSRSSIIALCVLCAMTTTAFAQDTQPTKPAKASSLGSAYKKEFTYLEAQKAALTKRLQTVTRTEAARVRKAQGQLNALSGRLLGLTVQADKIEAQLLDAERKVAVVSDREDALKATIEQASATLKTHNIKLPLVEAQTKDPGLKAKQQTAAIADAFEQGLGLLNQWQSIRKAQGHMFLPDGARVPATIVRVGNIAAFGVSQGAAGALAPAGGKRLKLWPKDAASSAKAMASGNKPKVVHLFLFESLEKNIEQKKEKTALETIEAGGIVAWVIVVLGLIGLALVILRGLVFALTALKGRSLLKTIEPMITEEQFADAAKACHGQGAFGRVVGATCLALTRERDEIDNAIAEAILRESPRLERFGTAIMVFASVAPLLGLLGTVTGMISTFDVITEFGTGDPKMLSGGISEALITTQLGLVVAIPLLLLGNLTNGVANNLLTGFERGALFVLNRAGVHPQSAEIQEEPVADEPQSVVGPDALGAV